MSSQFSHEFSRELYEEAPCGLMVTDSNGTILNINNTLCTWLGYAAGDLVNTRKLQDLLSVGSKLYHQTHWAPLLQMQGSISEIQLEMLSATKQKIPILLNAIRRQRGDAICNELAFFRTFDRYTYEQELLLAKQSAEASLAERLEAERLVKNTESQLTALNEQLYSADKRKDEFLATLAHELRNPLAPMRNVLEIFRLRKLEDPKLEWGRKILDRQLNFLTHLVDDLMEVSRITQGRLDLKKTDMNAADAVKDAFEACQPSAIASQHQLTLRLPSVALMVHADHTRLVQMVLNILNNAIKYTPNGGSITVEVNKVESTVEISVKDTGIGIENNKLSSVFQMFSQVETALDRSQGGLGIGLALVKGLTQLHQGTVTARSEGLGKGSEFVIGLPLSVNQYVLEAQPMADSEMPNTGRRVLIIDDNIDITESLLTAFELFGHQALAANDGLTGIALASTFLPDIILLDIGLPGINGYEIAKRIRNAPWGKKVTLIAATGWGQAQDKQLAKDAGFDHHLTKPIDFGELSVILNY